MAADLFNEKSQTPLIARVDFTPTREAGLARLKAFVPYSGSAYASRRNYDLGPSDLSNVSALSPWIRHRLVREEEVIAATLGRFALSTTEKFVQEVLWRGYFKGWLEHHPAVWRSYAEGVAADYSRLARETDVRRSYDAAIEGRTQIDCLDAWSRQLVETGYLHNHARMWFASIWIFTLELPWRLGADFFFRHLMDGDPASNTLSWRWVAGLHTRGKTYLARQANIRRYTNDRFDPGGLSPNAPPLEEADRPQRSPLKPGQTANFEPEERVGLLITDDDVDPSDLAPGVVPAAILGLRTIPFRSVEQVGDVAAAFHSGAIKNAVARLSAASRIPGSTLPLAGRPDEIDAILDWTRDNRLSGVMLAEPPVGSTRDALSPLFRRLAAAGVRIASPRRHYDHVVWPHASKGFFALKKRIPEILAELDVPLR